jgi:uncharacterized protein (UPF0548 family)
VLIASATPIRADAGVTPRVVGADAVSTSVLLFGRLALRIARVRIVRVRERTERRAGNYGSEGPCGRVPPDTVEMRRISRYGRGCV